MAEFKLGRIRFVWKNNWSTGTTYYKDDVVALGGKMYICVIGHTAAADFFTDFDVNPPKWNLVSDGFTWKGSWQTGTRYIYNDIVEYGARLYICNTVHTSADDSTSGLEIDQEKWTIYAEGLDWKGDWTTGTRYIVNDLVKYGGKTYVCITPHTSDATEAAGLEQDQEKWQVFNAGTEYKSTWTESTRYKVNDVVRYGAVLWICTTQHTSTGVFANDVANWEQYVRGFQFEGQWDPYATYQPGDVVRYGGNQYIAKTNHTEKNPSVELTDWDLFVEGINFKGPWGDDSSGQDYRVGDVVTHGAYSYICIADNNNQEPPNATYWQQLTAGLQWRGDWLDDQQYYLGDVVRYDSNSYICVQDHISEGDDYSSLGGAANSRPDQDTSGTYWNLIAATSELSVLTTKGDLAYYTGSTPARLPIGENGQVLTVSSSGLPEWAYLGDADDVYYVAEHGVDSPAPEYGRTIDRPWRTIRYATEQVENGTKRSQARRLLELNRLFIAREIVEWTEWQIANAAVGSIWENFDYESVKCERDMGYIIDAIAWDISHGGNVRSREAALAYVNDTIGSPYLSQKTQTVASINYGLSLIGNVLAQTAPATDYQTLNGDNSTAVIEQYTDATLTAESGVLAEITGLVGIITDAITAGVATNIPDRLIRNTLIKVSTGKYYEVLPIIVPAECCVIGDELRSTNVQPRKKSNGTLTSKSDYNFTYVGLSRVEAIISDIIQGSSVTATTGNVEVQSQLFPYGDVPQATAATTLMRSIKRKIDHGIKTKTEANLVGLADIHDVNYGYARNLILANKDFVAGEIVGYIADQYPDLKYSKTKCKQDVGYIIDAIAYDLSYDSNWQSVNAGLAYFDGTSGTLQIDATEKAATLATYTYMKSLLQTISQNLVVTPVLNTDNQVQVRGTPGNVTASNTIGSLVDDIRTIIDQGPSFAPAITYPDITGASAGLQADFAALNSAAATIKSNVTSFITTNFPDLVYNSAKCERDIGLIIDAARYDFCLGTNFASIVAAYSYLRQPSAKVVGEQKEATLAANEYARLQTRATVSEAAAIAQLDSTWQFVNDMIFVGSNEGNVRATEDHRSYAAVRQLELNKDFIVAEVHAYVADYFKSTVSGINGTTNVFTADDTSWMKPWMQIKFVSPDDSSNSVEDADLSETTTYYVRDILSSTTFTVAASIGGNALDLGDHEAAFDVKIGYDYNIALCSRDVTAYIDAMKWDMIYPQSFERNYTDSVSIVIPAWYKSSLAARYYINSVIGSQEEDFFYLRNGTGLRLMTMEGLSGDLTPANEYGTSRCTAGAYASLDPGWGPDDTRVWISARSPYVQNCTTFGYAATGQKIDGALHNGGNDSIVSNDFTQVISDGIGAHILNNGRAELVSVFTYYSHIGYLAESGGRIRATNGNNSYGDFGSVAEGVDPEEVAITAIVDNITQYRATISQINTDQSAILNIEYGHAGDDYTEANISIFGPGDNEELIADEFRDDGVKQVRLLDLDDSSGDIGGDGYTIVSNTAQDGNSTSITLSATDSSSATAYIGMKVIITSGGGVGQYGIVDTYNSGTKVLTVVRESDGVAGWDHLVPGSTIENPNSTSIYQIEPAISFSAPPSSSAAHTMPAGNTWNDIHWFETSELFTGVSGTASASGIGATFDVERVYSKYFVTVNSTGSGYTRLETITIPGTSLGGATPANDLVITVTTVNSVAGSVVDFDFDGDARGGKFIAISNTTAAAYSWDGETWTASTMPNPGAGGTWHRVADGLVDDGSSTYRASYAVAVADASNNVAYTDDGVTWSSTTLPVAMSSAGAKYIDYALITAGVGRFVVISDDDTDVAYSDDGGANWTLVSGALPGTGYAHLIRGKGVFVAVDNSGNAVYSADGISWSAGSGLPSLTYTDIAYGANKFVAVASNNNQGAYSLDGLNWTVLSLPAIASPTAYAKVEYGQGVFVATQTSTGSTVIKSEDGIYWQQVNVAADPGTPSGHGAIAFGNPARAGMFALTSAGASKTHVVKLRQGCRARGRPSIASEKIFEIRMLEPGSGYYSGAPTMTVTDPNNIYDINFTVRLGKGSLANPSFAARGTGFTQATGDIDTIGSDGYADFLQDGQYVAVRRLSLRPVPGSNVVFDSLPDQVFKLVNVVTFRGTNDGSYTAFLQLSPDMLNIDAPPDGDPVTMRIRYSQVRLTGHDFLDIGTGNFTKTNYPGTPTIDADQSKETQESDGGRVFYTSTDQDGNFRVGDLFTIEQATGVATLNAEAFNIAGLQELTLGQVTLGGNSASITEFSTDPFFTANSDTVVPTQRAVKAYIESQIGGGGASLNVNSVTAGDIFIGTNVIQNIAGGAINIQANVNFTGSVIGVPIAYNYFLR